MIKKLFLLVLALNIVPFIHKGKVLFANALYAQDWGEEGGDGDGGDDGDGDDDDGCGPTPPPTTDYTTFIDGGEMYGRTCTTSYPDCNGNGGGTDCVDADLGPVDCHGDLNGSAYIDDCSQCVGGNTGLTACVPCDQAEYDEAVQEYYDYVGMADPSPGNFYADPSDGSDGSGDPAPVIFSDTWVVVKALLGSWEIDASIDAKYYHYRYMTVNLQWEDDYDLFYYQVSNGFFTGSNTFIESTYTTITPTTNNVYNNNSPDTEGTSRVVGTVKHESKFKIKLPYCKPVELSTTSRVDNTMFFYPR